MRHDLEAINEIDSALSFLVGLTMAAEALDRDAGNAFVMIASAAIDRLNEAKSCLAGVASAEEPPSND